MISEDVALELHSRINWIKEERYKYESESTKAVLDLALAFMDTSTGQDFDLESALAETMTKLSSLVTLK